MKDEKIFDILERAEDDSMDRLIGKCPEISDNELDKILEMSERKYNMKKTGKNIDSQQENGGITVSGGEALLQIDFVTELFKLAKEKGVNTCLDTSGNPFTVEEPFFGKFNELMKYTDLFMLDIKHIDDEEHKKLTGQTNKNILDMAQYLSKNGKKMWIRHVLVPGITTDERYLKQLREFIDTLKTVDRVEVLPYHTLGVFKWNELGIPYQLEGVKPPTEEQIECAKRILNCQN